VKVDRRRWGTSVLRVRILAAGLMLGAAGCAVLGLGPRSGHIGTLSAATPALASSGPATPALLQQSIDSPQAAAQVRARSLLSGLPLRFEPNQGQAGLDPTDSRAKFVARGPAYGLYLGSQGAVLSLISRESSKKTSVQLHAIEMRLGGANSAANLKALDRLTGKTNYLIGNDPKKWRVGVPQFARVRYENIYPGINLVFYGNQGRLEYDFEVAPGADPAKAELEFRGAQRIALKDGALVITAGESSVQLEAPRVYQEVDGQRHSVEGRFVMRGENRAGFEVGPYDRSRQLVIDPVLNFSTYFGGTGDEHATSVAVDGSFNIYLAGSTTSADLPILVTGVYQTTLKGAGPNVYIAKITPASGSNVATLDYVTYLGGTGADSPVGIKVDGALHPFIAGTTSSTNFPFTSNAYQTTPASAGQHVFVTELSADATSLLYSTYLSGNGTDIATAMTINAAGNVFVTGTTTSVEPSGSSDEFPATSVPFPYQASSKAPGQPQFFVTEVNPIASNRGSIPYSTYFGGGTSATISPTTSAIAIGGGIAVDSSNNVYFSGTTNYSYSGCAGCGTTDFPILNAYQPCLDTAPPTTVLTSPTCSSTSPAAASDAFVAKLNLNPNLPAGQQLVWSTYVGGTDDDSSTGVALDPGAANVYIVGTTNSKDIATGITSLTTSASFQKCLDTPSSVLSPPASCDYTGLPSPAPSDAFVARLSNPALTTTTSTSSSTNVALGYFSYLGGKGDEAGNAITVDNGSGAVVTGWTMSTDFPVLNPPVQLSPTGGQHAFLARLYTAAVVGQTTTASWSSYFGGAGTDIGTGIALDVNQNTYLAGETNSSDLQEDKPLVPTQGGGHKGGYDAFVAQLGVAFSLSISGSLTQGTNQQGFVSAGNQATFTYTIQNAGPDLATNIAITDNLSSIVTGVPLTFNSASVSSGTCGGVSTNSIISCSLPSLQSGSTATLTIVVTPTGTPGGAQQSFNGGAVQVTAPGAINSPQMQAPAAMSDFSMTVAPANQTVPVAGQTASYTVALTPHPLYASNITISCSNLPTGASCAPTPSSTSLQGASGSSVNLAITTTARPVTTTTGALNFVRRNFYALWLTVPGFLLIGIRGDRRRRRIAAILSLCVLSTMILLIPACSHSTTQTPVSGTPAGSYTVTVTASSGSDSKTQTVGLVVP
jgi:uncharacterized repeat protein (TIGR01451 family)